MQITEANQEFAQSLGLFIEVEKDVQIWKGVAATADILWIYTLASDGGKSNPLVTFMSARDGSWGFRDQMELSDDIKEELPARIYSHKHLYTVLEFISAELGLSGDFPKKLEFKAENWLHDKVEVTQTSAKEFEVQGYPFRIGEVRIVDEDKDTVFEFTDVYSLDHDKEKPSYTVSRDLKPGKYSDELFHASEGDISRTGKSVIEVIAKIVAMCY